MLNLEKDYLSLNKNIIKGTLNDSRFINFYQTYCYL